MTAINQIRSAIARRAAYNRTLREISALPPKATDDLGLNPVNAKRIARAAVYGD